jgi:hypothetical protein
MKDKETAYQRIQELVEQFSHNHALYTQPHFGYNETQMRVENYYMTTMNLIGEITPFVLSLSKHEMSLFDKLRANGESTPLTHSTCQI